MTRDIKDGTSDKEREITPPLQDVPPELQKRSGILHGSPESTKVALHRTLSSEYSSRQPTLPGTSASIPSWYASRPDNTQQDESDLGHRHDTTGALSGPSEYARIWGTQPAGSQYTPRETTDTERSADIAHDSKPVSPSDSRASSGGGSPIWRKLRRVTSGMKGISKGDDSQR